MNEVCSVQQVYQVQHGFKRKATGYIIGVDFYIVTSRLISLTDSFNTIIYLLLKQNGCYSM